jgi:hypothetical protein
MWRGSRMGRSGVFVFVLAIGAIAASAGAAQATVLKQSCEFRLETWCDINQVDGPVTIHRARVTTTDAGLRSISATNVLNDEYLKRVSVQIEYTNEGGRKYKSFIKVRWVDADGEAIDGFGDEEGLEAHKARGMIKRSIGALKYGLVKAKTIEVEVNVNP